MEKLIWIISWSCVGVLWVNSEPTIRFRNWIYKMIYKYKGFEDKWHWRLLNCCLCSSFWIGLFGTGDILLAALVSVIAELLNQKLNSGSI
jgi:hypothetical protein